MLYSKNDSGESSTYNVSLLDDRLSNIKIVTEKN